MDITTYYFADYEEDEVSKQIVTQVLHLLQSNDTLIKIFQVNDEAMRRLSPGKKQRLKEKNSISIFSSSPSEENITGEAEPNQGLLVPPIRNKYARNIPRRHLSFGDEKNSSDTGASDLNNPIRYQSGTVSPNKKFETSNPTTDKTSENDKELISPSFSKCSTFSPKRSNQESPRSAKIAKKTSNLTKAETKLGSPVKVSGNIESSHQFPLSAEKNKRKSNPITIKKETIRILREYLETRASRRLESSYQFPLSAEKNKTSNPIANEEKTKRILREYLEEALSSLRDSDPEFTEKFEEPIDFESINKDSASVAGAIIKDSQPIMFGIESPSPFKKCQFWRPFTNSNKEAECTAKQYKTASSSLDNSPIKFHKTNLPPNESNKGIASDHRKRKSSSPKQISMTIFRSMPRVVELVEEARIYVEVPLSIEAITSPSTSVSSSVDYRSDAIKLRSSLASETDTDFSQTIFLKGHFSTSEQVTFATSSQITEKRSPVSVDTKKDSCQELQRYSGIANDGSKSLSPERRSMMTFRSMPRVVKSVEETETDVEMPLSLEVNTSPSTFGSPLSERKSDAIKFKSPLANETKRDFPRKRFLKRHLSLLEQATSETSSQNVSEQTSVETKTDSSTKTLQRYLSPSERSPPSEEDSSIGGEEIFVFEQLLGAFSISEAAVDDHSHKFESGSSNIEMDAFRLTNSVREFNTLLDSRDHYFLIEGFSFLDFKNFLYFLSKYVHKARFILEKILIKINKHSTKELMENFDSANAIVTKLKSKLTPMEKDLDSEMGIRHDYIILVQQEKAKYERLLSNEGEPKYSAEDLKVYECKIKDTWRKLDDLIMKSDLRRHSFNCISHDIISLMQHLVKCLIFVGLLLPC